MTNYKIHQGDCLDVLKTLESESVQMCVTSPPYFGLRNYGVEGQIGLEESPQAFVAKMVQVFEEVKRVLKPDGVLFLNLGDSYFGSGRGPTGHNGIGDQVKRQGFSSAANVRREVACDTSDKEPVSFQANDCLCQSLCDVCRKAYQIGKSHNGVPPVPKQFVSPFETNRDHKESRNDRLPTSGSSRLVNHSADAIQNSENLRFHVDELLHASLMSTLEQSSQTFPYKSSVASSQGVKCRLCERSLLDSSQVCVDRTACSCDIVTPLGALDSGRSGIVSSDLAYPNYTTAFLKPKDLIGIPWRVAFALQEAGWYLRQDIIWSKPNPMPESVTDRCTKAHEYIFLLTKNSKYYYDNEAIKEPVLASSIKRVEQSTPLRFGGNKYGDDPVYKIHSGKQWEPKSRDRSLPRNRNGITGSLDNWGSKNVAPKGQEPNSFHLSRLDGTPDTEYLNRNKHSVWTVTTKPYSEAHFATFPEKLIEPCILAGSCEGDLVLDPFCGAGTSLLVALKHNRIGMGIELNPTYIEIAERRLSEIQVKLF